LIFIIDEEINMKGWSKLSVEEKHQYQIAKAILKMPTPMANVMGDMSKPESKKIKKKLDAKMKGHHKGLTGMASTKYEGVGKI
jgi:hypothetical protein